MHVVAPCPAVVNSNSAAPNAEIFATRAPAEPAGHGVQLVAPSPSAKCPAGQVEHEVNGASACLYSPAGHAVQVPSFAMVEPVHANPGSQVLIVWLAQAMLPFEF